MADAYELACLDAGSSAVSDDVSSRQLTMFVVVCVIWGLTWIPVKVGVTAMAPLMFAALRFSVAGAILLALAWRRADRILPRRRHVGRFLVTGLFANAAIYGFLFWGLTQVSSGVAAVVNLSLIPTGLLITATLMGEERMDVTNVAATFTGVVGLIVLYSADVHDASALRNAGIVAIAFGTALCCVGIVASRELLRRYSVTVVSGWTQLIGATVLFAVAVLIDPSSIASARRLFEPRVFFSWAFLVVFGSVIAFTAYMRLTNEWSPSRAGAYAFVSPAIALVAGVIVLDESLAATEILGSGLMLVGAVISLRARGGTARR